MAAETGPARRAYITLGANIEPRHNLTRAVQMIADRCRVWAVSPLYETAPVGNPDQPTFLNAAIGVDTKLSWAALKQLLLGIEAALGRVRSADKNAPRPVDLDIAIIDSCRGEMDGHRLPDPAILRYAHVALPLADIAPALRHPETGESLAKIAARLPKAGILRRIAWTPLKNADQS